MSKKHWISIKRGLSEDPKHRQAMGEAIWLFLHMVDAADWEKGMVYDWRDREIAAEMSMSVATVRQWRQRLSEAGYITCNQKQHELEIIIHNWTDPRNYSGKVLNRREGNMDVSPSDEDKIQGTPQGDTQGDIQDDTQDAIHPIVNGISFIQSTSTSTSTSKSKTNTTRENSAKVYKAYEGEIGLITPFIRDAIEDHLDHATPPDWLIESFHIAAANSKRNWAYCEAILKRWKVDGKVALPPKAVPRWNGAQNKQRDKLERLANA